MSETELIRVEAPHFVGAIVVLDGRCIEAAPILRWAIGKSHKQLIEYFKRQGWDYEEGLK